MPLLAWAGVEGGDATTGPATAGGGSPGGGAEGWEGGASGGGELEEVEGVLPLPSPWAGMERGGGVTVACGGERWRAWRQRWEVREAASGGGLGCGARGRRGGPFIGEKRRWGGGGRAAGDTNGVWPLAGVVERRAAARTTR